MQTFKKHRAACALAAGIFLTPYIPYICDCFHHDNHLIAFNPPARYVLTGYETHADEPPNTPGTPLTAETIVAMASSSGDRSGRGTWQTGILTIRIRN